MQGVPTCPLSELASPQGGEQKGDAVTQQRSSMGIGASEISTVCGMNPFSSPWDLWTRKIGDAPDIEQNEPMEWGNRLEPAIRQKYCDVTGATVEIPKESLFHPGVTFARATPDGIVFCPDRIGLLQIKNVSYWVGREWEGAPPPYVQLQVQWEMFVCGDARNDVAALVGGSEFRLFTVHRDDKTIADLVSIATDFWRRVEQRIPPEIDNSDACREHLEKRLAKNSNVEMTADQELERDISAWRDHLKNIKHSTKEVERIRNIVRSHMADAQATRVVSTIGIAKLDTNKKLLAPREWSKEIA
jgi:putative phage-type endonuclease